MSYRLYVVVTLLIACGQPDPLGEAADSGALAADAGRSELRDAQSLPDAQPLDAPGVVPDAAAQDTSSEDAAPPKRSWTPARRMWARRTAGSRRRVAQIRGRTTQGD